jgi:hypothetical protein
MFDFRKLLFLCLCCVAAHGQTPTQAPTEAGLDESPADITLFRHPDAARYLVSGQANIIFQAHPGFHSPYSDTNSLLARGEYKVSMIGTLYLG